MLEDRLVRMEERRKQPDPFFKSKNIAEEKTPNRSTPNRLDEGRSSTAKRLSEDDDWPSRLPSIKSVDTGNHNAGEEDTAARQKLIPSEEEEEVALEKRILERKKATEENAGPSYPPTPTEALRRGGPRMQEEEEDSLYNEELLEKSPEVTAIMSEREFSPPVDLEGISVDMRKQPLHQKEEAK